MCLHLCGSTYLAWNPGGGDVVSHDVEWDGYDQDWDGYEEGQEWEGNEEWEVDEKEWECQGWEGCEECPETPHEAFAADDGEGWDEDLDGEVWEPNIRLPDFDREDPTWWMRDSPKAAEGALIKMKICIESKTVNTTSNVWDNTN